MENSLSIQYVSHSKNYKTKPVYQYDYGRQLNIIGLNSAYKVQCHYSIMGMKHALTEMPDFDATANAWVSKIPNILLIQSSDVICHVYVTTENSGSTMFEITIPIMERIKPGDYAYTNDELISLNNILEGLKSEQDNFDILKHDIGKLKQDFNQFIEITAPKNFQDFIDSKDEEVDNFIDAKEGIISPLVSSADKAARSANNAAEKADVATRAAENAAINANNSIAGLDDKVSDKVEQRISQITDALTEGSEYAAEVVSARTDEDGQVHTSLKTRIDHNVTELRDTKASAIIDKSAKAWHHDLYIQPKSDIQTVMHGISCIAYQATPKPPSPTNRRYLAGISSAGLIVDGKNLFSPSFGANRDANGIVVKRDENEDGAINVSVKGGHPDYVTHTYTLPICLPAGTYTLSVNNNKAAAGSTTDDGILMWCRQIDGKYTTATFFNIADAKKVFTTNLPFKILVLRIGKNVKNVEGLVIKPQLEFGSVATPFEPYRPAFKQFPISEGSLQGNGEINDTVENDVMIDGVRKCRITRRWKLLTATNGDDWSSSGGVDEHTYYFMNIGDYGSYINSDDSLCSHLTVVKGGITGNNTAIGFAHAPSSAGVHRLFVRTNDANLQPLKKWQDFIDKNYSESTPVQFLLMLAEPEVTITDPVPLESSGLLPERVMGSGETEVTYTHDTKHYIDSKISELVTLTLSNQ